MERAVAIKELGKILGKSLGYRVDPKAPDQDRRNEARAKMPDATAKRKALSERMEARRIEVLKADVEYQQLKAAHAEAKKCCDELFGITGPIMSSDRHLTANWLHALKRRGLFETMEVAPDQDRRNEARAKMPDATAKRKALSERMEARRIEVLKADVEYQQLKAAHAEAKKCCDELFGITCHYRFTVGTSNGMFFMVRAQGDSWDEVISKLTVKEPA